MIRSLYLREDGEGQIDLGADGLLAALQDASGVLWVDISCEAAQACEPILRETFGFHPLAVEDALEEAHVPKVDDWGQYLYLALHAVALDQEEGERLHTRELDVFLGSNSTLFF